jgi:hypothetical protein
VKEQGRTSGGPPTRLFRVDTPHDIASVVFVTRDLPPGRDVLAISTDKTRGDREQYAKSLRTIAALHAWSEIVDVSGLPLARHFLSEERSISRRQRLRDTIESARRLRRQLAQVVEQVDELYLTVLMHPDVLMLYGLLPEARKVYYPHGFDCLHRLEIHLYAKLFSTGGPHRPPWRTALLDRAKKLIFGTDAVIPRRIAIDEAYSFNLALPWAKVNHDLRSRLNRESMQALFSRLPKAIRISLEGLARQCQDTTTLLLLPPRDHDFSFTLEQQANVVAELAQRVVTREGSNTLLLKPHPRNSEQQVETIVSRISEILPQTPTVLMREHHEYPVEVVLSPFSVKSCAALGSTSLRTLKRIYGTRSYCAEQAMLELYAREHETILNRYKVWIEDNREDYIAI